MRMKKTLFLLLVIMTTLTGCDPVHRFDIELSQKSTQQSHVRGLNRYDEWIDLPVAEETVTGYGKTTRYTLIGIAPGLRRFTIDSGDRTHLFIRNAEGYYLQSAPTRTYKLLKTRSILFLFGVFGCDTCLRIDMATLGVGTVPEKTP